MEGLKTASLGWATALLADSRSDRKIFSRDIHSSLALTFVSYERKKIVIPLGPGANVIKQFTSVIYGFS